MEGPVHPDKGSNAGDENKTDQQARPARFFV